MKTDRSILGTILSIVGELTLDILVMSILTCFLGLLFAPVMEPILLKGLKEKTHGTWTHPLTVEEMNRAERNVNFGRIFLWIIAILSWTVLITTRINGYSRS